MVVSQLYKPVKMVLDNKDFNKEITKAVESIAVLRNKFVDIKAKFNYTSREKVRCCGFVLCVITMNGKTTLVLCCYFPQSISTYYVNRTNVEVFYAT